MGARDALRGPGEAAALRQVKEGARGQPQGQGRGGTHLRDGGRLAEEGAGQEGRKPASGLCLSLGACGEWKCSQVEPGSGFKGLNTV